MILTKEQISTAVRNASQYLTHMTVERGGHYWTPGRVNSLFKYALKSIGATPADALETRNAHWAQDRESPDPDWDLGKQIGAELAWHIHWCGRRVRHAPYPNYYC